MQRHLFYKTLSIPFFAQLLTASVSAENESALDKAVNKAEEITQMLSFEKIFNELTFGISSCFESLSLVLCLGISVLLVWGVFSCFKDSFGTGGEIFDVIATLMLVLCCLHGFCCCFETVEKAIEMMCSYMTSFVPVSVSLLYASGNTVTAGTGAAMTSFFISAVQLVSVSLILPCIKTVCGITAVNTLCRKTNLTGIVSFFKSTCLWIIGLSFTILCGVLSLQTLLTSGADNLALKGIKYSAAKLIPIASGMVSESMKTVIATMNYIKSVTGAGAVVYIVYTVILPVCSIAVTKLSFLLLSALAKAANSDKAVSLFDGIQGILNILSALLIGVCVSFVVVIGLFIRIAVSL